MLKVFISVGMRGRSNKDVERDIERAKSRIHKMYPDKDVVTVDNWDCQGPKDAGRTWYLGEAIKKLGDCDLCYFCTGWQNNRGCRAEMEICKIYGIETIEE